MSNSGPGTWTRIPGREQTYLSREAYVSLRGFLEQVADIAPLFMREEAAAALDLLDGEVPALWRPAPLARFQARFEYVRRTYRGELAPVPDDLDPYPFSPTDEEIEP